MRTGSNACFFINGKLIDRVKMAMEKTVLSQGLNGDRAANPAQSKPSVFGNLEFGKVPPWPELGFDPANYRRGGLVSAVTRRLGQATPEAGLHIDQLSSKSATAAAVGTASIRLQHRERARSAPSISTVAASSS